LPNNVSDKLRASTCRALFPYTTLFRSADFQHFRTCALGAGVVQTNPACVDARLDADADVDMDDFGIFQRCYSGAGVPANPYCNQARLSPRFNSRRVPTSCDVTCRKTTS